MDYPFQFSSRSQCNLGWSSFGSEWCDLMWCDYSKHHAHAYMFLSSHAICMYMALFVVFWQIRWVEMCLWNFRLIQAASIFKMPYIAWCLQDAHTHRQKKAVDTDPNLGLDPLAATGSMPAVYRNSGNAKLDSNGTPNGYEANKRDLLTNFRLGANMMMGYCISKVKSININLLSCWEIKATNWNSMLVSKILGLSHWMPVLCLKISPRLRYWSSSTPKHTP